MLVKPLSSVLCSFPLPAGWNTEVMAGSGTVSLDLTSCVLHKSKRYHLHRMYTYLHKQEIFCLIGTTVLLDLLLVNKPNSN